MPPKRVPPVAAGGVFLACLARGMSVAAAAQSTGVPRQTVYKWRAHPAFAEAWAEAIETATDRLEDEARRRALEGVKKPVYRNGQIVGYVKNPSDRLLMALLAAERPEKFRAAQPTRHAVRNEVERDGARATLERKLARLARRLAPPRPPEKTD